MTTLDLTIGAIEEAIGRPFESWAHTCHATSLAIVKAGLVPGGRVTRGWCNGVSSQHSWVTVEMWRAEWFDADFWQGEALLINPAALIIDPTLWSYRDDVEGVWVGTLDDGLHVPHGAGSIWDWGKPTRGAGETITRPRGLSPAAKDFLDLIGPLDYEGWSRLIHAPVEGWPSHEILTAVYEVRHLAGIPPIDIIGMYTDHNPKGLYW